MFQYKVILVLRYLVICARYIFISCEQLGNVSDGVK